MLAARKRRGLFDPDHVVFESEVSVDVLLVLKVTRDDARAIREIQHATIRAELMRQPVKQSPPKILEVFNVRFADLPKQKAF